MLPSLLSPLQEQQALGQRDKEAAAKQLLAAAAAARKAEAEQRAARLREWDAEEVRTAAVWQRPSVAAPNTGRAAAATSA